MAFSPYRTAGALITAAAAAVTITATSGAATADVSPSPPGAAGKPVPATIALTLGSKDCVSGGPKAEDDIVADYISPKMNGSRLNSLNAGEASCARVIVNTIRDRGLPKRAAEIALTTAITESTLHNYTEAADHDSYGLYQQRPSQGWGTFEQVTDPVHATNSFINAMLNHYPNGGWKTADIGTVCQTVQVSAYPDAYNREVYDAKLIAGVLWDSIPSGWATSTASRLRIMQTGSAGKMYEDGSGLATSSWNEWTSIGKGDRSLTGPPAIIYRSGRYDVFGVASDGRIWHRIYHDGAWNDWHALTSAAGSPIVAKEGSGVSATWGDGHQRLFYISPGNHVYQTWYDDGWHSQSLGGDFRGTPGAIIIGGRMDVYAIDPDGYLYHRPHTNGSWHSWTAVKTANGIARAKVGTGVAAIHGNGRDRLFYIAPGENVEQTYYDNGWVSQSLGGDYRGVPAVVWDGSQIDLFATGAAGNVFHRRRRIGGDWSSWTKIVDAP